MLMFLEIKPGRGECIMHIIDAENNQYHGALKIPLSTAKELAKVVKKQSEKFGEIQVISTNKMFNKIYSEILSKDV